MSEKEGAPDLEKLMPDSQRRRLTTAFIERASKIVEVEKISLVDLGKGKNKRSRLFVFAKSFEGLPVPDPGGMIKMFDVLTEVCANEGDFELLDMATPMTEAEFLDDRNTLTKYRIGEPVTLWEKPKSFFARNPEPTRNL